jgi:hypothetical protein
MRHLMNYRYRVDVHGSIHVSARGNLSEAFAAVFETGLSHRRRYVAARPPQRDVIDGFPIGIWVAIRGADYRRGRLSAKRISARLEDLVRIEYPPPAVDRWTDPARPALAILAIRNRTKR